MRLRRDPDRHNGGHSKRASAAGLSGQQLPPGTAGTATKPQGPTTGVARVQRDSAEPQARRAWLGFALLSLATFICYAPCLNGQFVWDDDAWTLHLETIFRDPSGLVTI